MENIEKLVSILVITYNSSAFVEETLSSIGEQDYTNIELIISDDCSTDNTVEICHSWIEKHAHRFVKTKIITSPNNTGIPSNCNRGIKNCSGEWIKLIAGDDILLPTAISDYMQAIATEDTYVFAQVQSFRIENGKKKILDLLPDSKRFRLFDLSADEQHKALLQSFFIGCTPSIFIKTETIKECGYYNEKYKYMEDYPLAFNITKKGYKAKLIKKPTVLYRIHSNNISTAHNKEFYNKKFFENLENFRKDHIYTELPQLKKIIFLESFYLNKLQYLIITKLFNNKTSFITKLINSITKRLILERYVKYYKY